MPRSCPFLRIQKDKLIVKYIGQGLLHSDIAVTFLNQTVQSETPVKSYFEVRVLDTGAKPGIMVGFGPNQFPLNKFPGQVKKLEINLVQSAIKPTAGFLSTKKSKSTNFLLSKSMMWWAVGSTISTMKYSSP